MATACTNTGASLLLGSPVKPSGKRSAATSPMKEKEINHRKEFVELPCLYYSYSSLILVTMKILTDCPSDHIHI